MAWNQIAIFTAHYSKIKMLSCRRMFSELLLLNSIHVIMIMHIHDHSH